MGAEKVSMRLASALGEKSNKTDEEIEVLNYGLFVIIQTIYSVVFILAVGSITGLLMELTIISLCSAMMKKYAGGPHASTANRCLIIGIIIATLCAFLSKFCAEVLNNTYTVILSTLVIVNAYYVLYKRCPVGSREKPLKKESIRKRLRKKAFFLMNIYSLVIITLQIILIKGSSNFVEKVLLSITFGLVLQIFTLSKLGEYIVLWLDKYLNKFV